MARCTGCQSLTGKPTEAPPHGGMVKIDERKYVGSWAGGGEAQYRCLICNCVMGRDTDELDPFAVWVNR
jgi:hypothetical protein